jgi:hypothetical protein
LDAAALAAVVSRLAEPIGAGGAHDVDDADLICQIGQLERVKAACAARQARLSVLFDTSQRARQRARGLRPKKVGRGTGEQLALARRESPSRGAKHLREARALVLQMPHMLAALAAGEVSEWAASLAVAETACLTGEDRGRVDAELADRLGQMSPAQVRGHAAAATARLDPAAVVARNATAVNQRRVWVRPAPDCMTYLTALLPVKEGVACYAALHHAAGTAQRAGDPRGRGQVMADTLIHRLTHPGASSPPATPGGDTTVDASVDGAAGATSDPAAASDPAGERASAGAGGAAGDAVEVCLVMTDTALLAGGDDPALVTSDLSGSNPAAAMVPAPVARDLVRDAATVFARRLYTDPHSGQLVAMESTRRVFDGNLRRLLLLRDGVCRTPWCDAPVRHADHVVPFADGGPTSLANGQGLCEGCNQTKTLPGWTADVLHTGPGEHTVRTTTPTGHTYDSTAPPPLPGVPSPRGQPSVPGVPSRPGVPSQPSAPGLANLPGMPASTRELSSAPSSGTSPPQELPWWDLPWHPESPVELAMSVHLHELVPT